MRSRKGFLPQDSAFPMMGLNHYGPSTMLGPGYSPSLRNVEVRDNIIEKRAGYYQLGDDLPDPVIGVVNFEDIDGNNFLVAFTTTRRYRYDVTTNAWVDITGGSTVWTGDEDNALDYTIGQDESGKYLIATNGKDKIVWWQGTGNFTDFSPVGYDSLETCETLAIFYDHLVLGNVIVDGSRESQVIAWSDTADFDDFENGNTGTNILTDSLGPLVRLIGLGDRLVLYSEDSIGMLNFVGGQVIFGYDQYVRNTRLLNKRSIVDLGSFHVFANQENFMMFDGTRLARPIGNSVYTKYREEVDLTKANRAFAFHDTPKRQVYFVAPTSVDDSAVGAYVFNYDVFDLSQSRWSHLRFSDNPLCMGYYERDETLTWDSPLLTGITWAEMTGVWNEGSAREDFPVVAFGSGVKVYLADRTRKNDAGSAIEAWWDTKDYNAAELYKSLVGRWLEVECELKGDYVEVEYSVDEGESYTQISTTTLTGSWRRYRFPIDVLDRTLRVRFKNDTLNSEFQLRWGRVWLKPGGAYDDAS